MRLAEWPDLLGAWLFGSVARGDANEASDVDVLIVAKDLDSADLHERLALLGGDVRSWTGNELQIVEHSASSWRKLVQTSNPLVDQMRREAIALTDDAATLLGRRR
jgi:predicted nucleotidyltransferase